MKRCNYLILNNYWTAYREDLFEEIVKVNPDAVCAYAAPLPQNRRKMGWHKKNIPYLAWNIRVFGYNIIVPKLLAATTILKYDRVLISSGRDMVLFVALTYFLRIFAKIEVYLWVGDPQLQKVHKLSWGKRFADNLKSTFTKMSDGLLVYSRNTLDVLPPKIYESRAVLIGGQVSKLSFADISKKEFSEALKIGFLNGTDPRKNLNQLFADISTISLNLQRAVEIHDVCGVSDKRQIFDNLTLINYEYMEKNDFNSFLASMDVFVLCSTEEPWGFVAAEAIAAGCPVLCTKNCGIATILPDPAIYPLNNPATLLTRLSNLDKLLEAQRAILEKQSIPKHACQIDTFLGAIENGSGVIDGYN